MLHYSFGTWGPKSNILKLISDGTYCCPSFSVHILRKRNGFSPAKLGATLLELFLPMGKLAIFCSYEFLFLNLQSSWIIFSPISLSFYLRFLNFLNDFIPLEIRESFVSTAYLFTEQQLQTSAEYLLCQTSQPLQLKYNGEMYFLSITLWLTGRRSHGRMVRVVPCILRRPG